MSEDFIIVCAIDFGTTFSGYAFSFKTSPEDIKMNKNWGGSSGFQSYKTATSVLTDASGQCIDFGFSAEDEYGSIKEEDSDTSYHLFRRFKMMLHQEKDMSTSTKVKSIDGEHVEAVKIFAYALKYLKQHLMKEIAQNLDSNRSVNLDLIRWVVTVPAIWTEKSKQFMREAALQAGLITTRNSAQLLIALEPEAASLCCRQLELTKESLRAGTKYMVIDAGGGTVDITTHEVLESGGVKELYVASGGYWGGTRVDDNFTELMGNVLGNDFMNRYRAKQPKAWFDMLLIFEKGKKSVKANGKSTINIPISYSMIKIYSDLTHGKDIEKGLRENGKQYDVAFSNGTIVIKYEAVKKLFEPVLDEIVSHITKLLDKYPEYSIDYFFLVGGFSESEVLQERIKREFSKTVKIIIPSDAQMAVIKGAVLFGHRPDDIDSRIAKRTYGTDIATRFQDGVHKEDKKVCFDGVDYCKDLLEVYIHKGDRIPNHKKLTNVFTPVRAEQKEMQCDFYSLDRLPSNPQYVDEFDVHKLGSGITVQMPNTSGGKSRKVELSFTFGGTEIKVDARDLTSGNTAETSLNFLSS